MKKINLSKLTVVQKRVFSSRLIEVLKDIRQKGKSPFIFRILLWLFNKLKWDDSLKWKTRFLELKKKREEALKKFLNPLEREIIKTLFQMDKTTLKIIDCELKHKEISKKMKKLEIFNNYHNFSVVENYLDLFFLNLKISKNRIKRLSEKIRHQEKLEELLRQQKTEPNMSEIFIALFIDHLEKLDVEYAATKVVLAKRMMEKLHMENQIFMLQTNGLRKTAKKNLEMIDYASKEIHKLYLNTVL